MNVINFYFFNEKINSFFFLGPSGKYMFNLLITQLLLQGNGNN